MAIDDYYDQTVVTKRTTTSKSTLGSTVDSWATNLTILGKIRPKSGKDIIYNDKREIVSDYDLYCKVVDILEKDRVECEDKTYTVIFVKNPMNMSHHLEVSLKLIA